jgi:hypothetical protein
MAYVDQKEREWLARKIGSATVTAQTRIGQLRRRYYAQVVGAGTPQTGMSDLETQWLLKEIANRGGTPAGGETSELWKQLVAIVGQTPSKYLDQNRLLFYTYAA